ncbi:MAG TPA: DNA repair protein RecO [Anaerolineae bacterium]|nr:DNA repair protein RecO [Anaerolineae bacterium]
MSRPRTYRLDAIVLRRSDFGEADRLLTLYTAERGKLKAIAKGARKPQSRKTGHVELFMRTHFMLASGRDLDIVTQAELIASYEGLRRDLIRTTYAAYYVELLDQFTVEEDPQPNLYELIRDALGWLETAPDVRLPTRHYELRLLSLTGYQPQLFYCVNCGHPIKEEDQFFNAERGGFVCAQCGHPDRHTIPVTAATVKLLRFLQTRPWSTIAPLTLKNNLHRQLETTMHHYLTHTLERNLKSIAFINRLRHEATLFTPPPQS